MTDTAAAAPATTQPKSPGLLERMIGVVFSPRETFAAVAARPRWFGVMAVGLVIVSAAYYLILSSPDMQQGIVDQQVRAIEARGTTVSDQQYANMERIIGYTPIIYAVVIPILGPLFTAATAGILTGIFTALMGGTGTFKQVYAIQAHAGIISMFSAVLAAAMILAGVKPQGVRPPGANLGVFVPMLDETSFVYIMLRTIDLTLVWWLFTLAVGLGVLYKRKTAPIFMTFLGLYLGIALLVASFTSGS
jgi:hypothetical protein